MEKQIPGKAGEISQKKELRTYVNEILTELMTTSFNELLKISDKAMVNAFCKIINKQGMSMFLTQAKTQGWGTIGNEMKDIVTMMQWGHISLSGPENVEVELRENGAVGTLHNCIFKDFLPDFCIVLSHYSVASFCELINSEYDSLWLNRMSEGDPFCRYIVKKKSISYERLEDLGKVVGMLPPPQGDEELLKNIATSMISFHWIEFTIVFNEIHGSEKTMKVLGPNARQIGLGAGTSLKQSKILQGTDARGLGSLIDSLEKDMGKAGNVISSTPRLYSKEITSCPFKDAPPELCMQMEEFNNGICQAVNPELKFKYSRMMTAREPTCLWSVTKK